MIEFVTSATGSAARKQAQNLAESFMQWNWPELTVVTDSPLDLPHGVHNALGTEDLWKGRGLKSQFGQFARGDGMVAWIDADCEACGDFQPVRKMDAGTVSGIVIGKCNLPPWMAFIGGMEKLEQRGMFLYLASTILICDSRETALKLSEGWHKELKGYSAPGCDEVGLNRVLAGFIRKQGPGHFLSPLPNLKHLADTKGRMPSMIHQ